MPYRRSDNSMCTSYTFPDSPGKEVDLEEAGNLRAAVVLSHRGVRAGARSRPGEAPGGHPPVEEGGCRRGADRNQPGAAAVHVKSDGGRPADPGRAGGPSAHAPRPVSYTHLRAHETKANLVCR